MEQISPAILEQIQPNYYRGLIVYAATEAAAAGDAKAIVGTAFPVAMADGETAPVACKYNITYQPNGRKGVAHVKVQYETSMIGKVRIVVMQKPDKGERILTENATPANIVEGWESDGIHEWRVVSGSNVINSAHWFAKVETAYTAAGVNTATGLARDLTQRNINSTTITGTFGSDVTANKLRWMGMMRQYTRSDEYPVAYYVAYRNEGWDTYVKSQKGVWIPRENYVVGTSGVADLTKSNRHMVYYPGRTYTPATGAFDPVLAQPAAAAVERNVFIGHANISSLLSGFTQI